MKRVQPVAPPQFSRHRDEAKNPTSGASAGGHANSCTRRPKFICALSLVTANINDQRNLFHISRLCFSPTAKLSFSSLRREQKEWLRDRGLFSLVWSSSNLYLCDLLIYYICCWLLNISIYFYLCLIISLLSWVNFTDFYRFWSMNESPARRVERDDRKMKTDFSSSVVVMSQPPQSVSQDQKYLLFYF